MNPADVFRLLAERTADVYWTTDEKGILTYVAPQIEDLIGHRPEDVVGLPLGAFVHEEDSAEAASLQDAILERKNRCTVAYRLRRSAEDPLWVEATIHAVRSPEGVITGFAGRWQDITERRRIEEAYEYLGYHDSLTSLPNRRLFEDRLTIALAHARRYESLVALLHINVDRLNRINDSLGHAVGDEVLRLIGRRISTIVRASDTFARLAGDEFALLVSNLRYPEDAVRIAQIVLQKVKDPLAIGGQELFLTASVGIALFPQDGNEVSGLLVSADAAVHACKQMGGDGWYVHNSSVNERALQRLAVELDLHRGLQRSEFVVRYQPLLAVAKEGKEQMTAVEALVRWQHPSRGELSPAAFLDVAEETGLIVGMGEQVIQSACAQANRWVGEGWENPSVSINVSARQFEHPKLLEALDDAVMQNNVPPSMLQLEITEGTALRDLTRTIRILEELRARGIRVAIDDFGIGYSSLGYLKDLPVSALKIDKTFIDGVPEGRDAAIVGAVIDMGHALGLTVIAEGVERPEQMEFLRARGCDVCQGYLFSKPTTADEIIRMRRN